MNASVVPLVGSDKVVRKVVNGIVREAVPFGGFTGSGVTARLGIGLIFRGHEGNPLFGSSSTLRDPVRVYQAMKFLGFASFTQVTEETLTRCIDIVSADTLEKSWAPEGIAYMSEKLGLVAEADLLRLRKKARTVRLSKWTIDRMCETLRGAGVPIVVSSDLQHQRRAPWGELQKVEMAAAS